MEQKHHYRKNHQLWNTRYSTQGVLCGHSCVCTRLRYRPSAKRYQHSPWSHSMDRLSWRNKQLENKLVMCLISFLVSLNLLFTEWLSELEELRQVSGSSHHTVDNTVLRSKNVALLLKPHKPSFFKCLLSSQNFFKRTQLELTELLRTITITSLLFQFYAIILMILTNLKGKL